MAHSMNNVRLLIVTFIALSCVTGCIASRLHEQSSRSVQSGMEVFVQSSIEYHLMDTAVVFPFSSPPEWENTIGAMTSAFQARLVQRQPFREIKALPYSVKSDAEALWFARNEGCSLAVIPSTLYRMDGTGAMPTKVVIRTRILDARSGNVLWDVKQEAISEPGADVDLTWTTISGQPAQRCYVLVDRLASQFADFLALPMKWK